MLLQKNEEFLLDKIGIRKLMVNCISIEIIPSLLHREYIAVLIYLKVLAMKRNKCINTSLIYITSVVIMEVKCLGLGWNVLNGN